MSEHIGYKKCKDDRIVILEILGDNNENRLNIHNKNYAKMRCSKARVLEIYDMNDRSKKFNSAIGLHDPSFEYIVGEIIEPNNGFDSNLENVCASGIHYFLTEAPAYFWNYEPVNGEYKSWCDNGLINEECTYKDGKKYGSCKSYYSNGQIRIDYTIHKDMILDGPYKSYYKNGQIEVDCTYKDGYEDGPYKSYYKNGQIATDRTYKNGKLDGSYKKYHENGQIKEECTYKDGNEVGSYKEYYKNGQIRIECTYKDGKLNGSYKSYHENGQIFEEYTYKNGILKKLK